MAVCFLTECNDDRSFFVSIFENVGEQIVKDSLDQSRIAFKIRKWFIGDLR